MKANSKINELIINNRKFVYYCIGQLGINPGSSDYEDMVSIGNLGLIKAANTFDETKGIKFITYANTCIRNEIFMYQRKNKKYMSCVSLEESIAGEEGELTLDQMIKDPNADFVSKLNDEADFTNSVNIILNYLTESEKLVMLYWMADFSQAETAKACKLSQSYVSRVRANAISKIIKLMELEVNYRDTFSMRKTENYYELVILFKKIEYFDIIFEDFLHNIQEDNTLNNFEVSLNGEQVVIQLPLDEKAFVFIAKLMKSINSYIITDET